MSKIIEKVTAFITRRSRDGSDLLLFEHPNAGIQIPAGTVEDQERPKEAYCERVQPIRLCFQRVKVPP